MKIGKPDNGIPVAGNDFSLSVCHIDIALCADYLCVHLIELAFIRVDHQITDDLSLAVQHSPGSRVCVYPENPIPVTGHIHNLSASLIEIPVPYFVFGIHIIIVLRSGNRTVAYSALGQKDHVEIQIYLIERHLKLFCQLIHIAGKVFSVILFQFLYRSEEAAVVVVKIRQRINIGLKLAGTL